MFQKKIEETFRELSNVFGIVNDVLIGGFGDDGTL